MNRKIISMAASAALIGVLTGCGGGGGGTTGTTTSSTNTGTTAQPTKVKGVDGYVMNAKVSVVYWDTDKNVTVTKELKDKSNYYFTLDKATGKPKAGNPVYSLAEIENNATIFNHIVSVVMTSQAQGKDADGNVYAQSFFDADANGEYNATQDVLFPVGASIKAPKGYAVITPISTTIAAAIEAKLAADKNESNLTSVIEDYTKGVAKALGIDDNTLKSVDPLSLTKSKDPKQKAFVMANALAGALIVQGANANALKTVADTLKKAQAPKKPEDVIKNVASAAKKAGQTAIANAFEQVANILVSSPESIDELVKANLDKTRANIISGNGVVFVGGGEVKEFNLTDTGPNVVNDAPSRGYKIYPNDLDKITLELKPNEQNTTTQTLYFVIDVRNERPYMAHKKLVNSLTVKVPVEVNSTDGTIDATIPADAKIVYDGVNYAGNKIVNAEKNLSAMNINLSDIFAVDQNNNKITIKAKTLLQKIDSNTSNEFNVSNNLNIANVTAIVTKDHLTPVDNGSVVIAPVASVTSDSGKINESGLMLLGYNNDTLVADLREGSVSHKNLAPNNDINLTVDSDFKTSYDNNSFAKASDTNKTMSGRVIVNNNTALDINLTASTVDTYEKNTTVAFTLGSYLTDKNLSTVVKALKANSAQDAFATNAIDVNTTNTTDGNLTTALTFKVTDEFGESNTTTLYMVVNRKPVIKTSVSNDKNLTFLKDYDAWSNLNVPKVVIYDWNGSQYTNITLNSTYQDVNVSHTGSTAHTVKIKLVDGNKTLEFNESVTGHSSDWNITLDINATDGYLDLNETHYRLSW